MKTRRCTSNGQLDSIPNTSDSSVCSRSYFNRLQMNNIRSGLTKTSKTLCGMLFYPSCHCYKACYCYEELLPTSTVQQAPQKADASSTAKEASSPSHKRTISGVLDGHVHPSPETKRDFVSNDPVSIQCLRPYCALTTPSSLTSDIHRWCDSNS